jgi:AraC-like DNA-binding protein
MRLERAAQLLAQQAGSVQEIAYRVGFRDSEHFSKLFRQAFGVLPSSYPVEGT